MATTLSYCFTELDEKNGFAQICSSQINMSQKCRNFGVNLRKRRQRPHVPTKKEGIVNMEVNMEIKVLTPDLLLRIYNFPFFRPVCIF